MSHPPEPHPALRRSREQLEAIETECDVSFSCGRCGSAEWVVWRSILGSNRRQNDIMVKCQVCWHVSWHGVPMERDAWEAERERRPKANIDAVGDGEGDVEDRLQALGYIGGDAESIPTGENVRYQHGPGSPAKPR